MFLEFKGFAHLALHKVVHRCGYSYNIPVEFIHTQPLCTNWGYPAGTL